MKPLTGFLLLAGVAVGVGVAIAIENKQSAPQHPKPNPSPGPTPVSSHSTTYSFGYFANGMVASLNVGDRIHTHLAILAPGIDWSLESNNPSVLARDADSVHAILPHAPPGSPEASDWWLAVGPGRTFLTGQQVGGQGKFSLTVDVA